MLETRARSTCFGGKHKTKQTRRRRHFSLERFSLLLLSMASLKATREAVLFAYCEEWLHDVEFLLLDELNTSENLDFHYMIHTIGSISKISTKQSVLLNFVLRNDTFCDLKRCYRSLL